MFVNVPWTDTTYTVGDGGLTQKNFTTTLKSKLDAIEASADVTDATNVAAAGAVMNTGDETIDGVKTFSSTITGDISGNAATATALATSRNINGVAFNGTGDITITAAGSTLSNTVPITKGGTGATSASAARTALGLGSIATRTAPTGTVVGTTDTQTLSSKTLSGATLTGTLNVGGGTGSSGQILKSTGTGVQWADESGGSGQKIHARVSYHTATQVLSTGWQHLPHVSNAADRAVYLSGSPTRSSTQKYCLCEVTLPRLRPYSKLIYFAIQDYQNNNYWDARGGYGSGYTPAAYAGHYDDNNNQNTMTWKIVIDLSDSGSGWQTRTFKLGPKIKASGTAYIYGNATGQYIFKVTELDSVGATSGTPGCIRYGVP